MTIPDLSEIIERIEADSTMQDQWENYADSSFYVGNLSWKDVMVSVRSLSEKLK